MGWLCSTTALEGDRAAREQDRARPGDVLPEGALGKGLALPALPPHGGGDVVEGAPLVALSRSQAPEEGLRRAGIASRQAFDAFAPVGASPVREPLREQGVAVRARHLPGECAVAPGALESGAQRAQVAASLRQGVLNQQRDDLPAGLRDGVVPGSPVLELRAGDGEHAGPGGARSLGRTVARAGVDDQELHASIDVLLDERRERAREPRPAVERGDDDRNARRAGMVGVLHPAAAWRRSFCARARDLMTQTSELS
jgi:hypothetical protein